jgi:hypothetical protein
MESLPDFAPDKPDGSLNEQGLGKQFLLARGGSGSAPVVGGAGPHRGMTEVESRN